MSKKKSTMTLKDFHGGSIPSDLPLPSAPGVVVRPSDRSTFDRQIQGSAWGCPIGRPDHRSRPGSSGTGRSFDEKAAFLSHPPHIGRNFDEDERKPFDGGAALTSRRSVREDDLDGRPPSAVHADPVSNPCHGKLSSGPWQGTTVMSSHSTVAAAAKIPTSAMNAQHPSSNGGQSAVAGSAPNAWGMRKEVIEPVPSSSLSGPLSVSKLVHASALEKISSGRWQSKPVPAPVAALGHYHGPDVEVIRYSETESEDARFGVDQMNSRIYHDEVHGMHGEGGVKVSWDGERGRNSTFYSDRVQAASAEGKLGGYLYQFSSQAASELSERPKLKLLPRTKPLELQETQVGELKQVYQQPAESAHVETNNELYGNVNPSIPGTTVGDGSNRASFERPKLNLKPRSQPLEQLHSSGERERSTLFGGARPRELVLKERGVDELLVDNLDLNQPSNRVKQDLPKADMKLDTNIPNTHYSKKPENLPHDQRSGREYDKKDYRHDNDKTEVQRGSWKNENRRNSRDFEKQHEWRQEPESWRKSIDPPKPILSETNQGSRYGKAASALELAQAFSRTVSDAKQTDRFANVKNIPGRVQLPFSRLTETRDLYSGPAPRQINGY